MTGVELLAPAGSYESLVAAVHAGADAIYIGGSRFGARAYADNPEEDMLLQGIDYAHLYDVRIYMTVNTLLKDDEITELYDYIKPYYEAGLDAVIVQDMGVMKLIHEYFPDLDIHASTQMTVTGAYTSKLLKDMGVTRVVPAREISLKEIQSIDKSSDVEIECFVHGALCYSYSGQCLMSSLIGGRSGNRGRCAQTCRLNYELLDGHHKKINKEDEPCLLSCKDLCSIDILPQIIEAGVDSLKIEGRMKSPIYTAGVVSIWRKYLNLYEDLLSKNKLSEYRVDKKDRQSFLDLFDRGGQTEGYYSEHNGRDMIALHEKPEFREGNDALYKYIDETYVHGVRKLSLQGEATIKKGEPMVLELCEDAETPYGHKKRSVVVKGQVPEDAKNAAADEDTVRKQLSKLGGTSFAWDKLDITLDDGLFIPVSAYNELRREGIDRLKESILHEYRRKAIQPTTEHETITDSILQGQDGKLSVVCETIEQLDTVISMDEVEHISEIIWDGEIMSPDKWAEYTAKVRGLGIRAGLRMPHIYRTEASLYYNKYKKELTEASYDLILIRSLEELNYLNEIYNDAEKNAKPEYVFDYNLYSMNKYAKEIYTKLGANRLTAPVELNLKELHRLDVHKMDLIVYGRLPMMVSAQCLKKTTVGCDKKPELTYLKDRKDKLLPVKNNCTYCYNTIYNADPISLTGIYSSIAKLKPAYIRVWFTTEDKDMVRNILKTYIISSMEHKDMKDPVESYTRGHINRGVE